MFGPLDDWATTLDPRAGEHSAAETRQEQRSFRGERGCESGIQLVIFGLRVGLRAQCATENPCSGLETLSPVQSWSGNLPTPTALSPFQSFQVRKFEWISLSTL